MKSYRYSILLLLFVPCLVWAAREVGRTQHPVSDAHKKWMDEVHWLLSDYEKNAFFSLKTDQDRNRFIQQFWLDRDPTPGTEQNEFREEHYQRLEHATKQFGRESTLPGWKTDRGRAYILLGKPKFTKRFQGSRKTHPLELWHYTGSQGYGLPSSFYMLFYQRNGVGPYRLYSPFSDGLRALFIFDHEIMDKSEEELVDYLRRDVDPEVGHAVLTPIPSEGGDLAMGLGNMDAELIEAKLHNARNYQVEKRKYVEAFLHDRPAVQVYVSMDMKGVQDGVYWFRGPNGQYYIDYAVEYEPDRLDMGHYEDYYTSLTVDGSISTPQKVQIDRILNTHEIKVNEQQFQQIKSIPFQYHGRRPLVAGNYDFTFVISNNVSRRGATFVNKVAIPDFSKGTAAYFPPLIPVRLVENVSDKDGKVRPFQFGDKLYYPNLSGKYQQGGTLQVFHQIIFPELFAAVGGNYTLNYVVQRGDQVEKQTTDPLNYTASDLAGNALEIKKDIPLTGVPLGPHRLIVQLKQDDKLLAQSEALVFTVAPKVNPGVWKFSVGLPDFQSEFHKLALAQQMIRLNRNQEALGLLEMANRLNPDSPQTKLQLVQTAMRAKEYAKALDLARPLEVNNPRDKELLWMMGWAYYELEKYEDAVRMFERLRIEDPKKVEVLNILADVYYRLNQRDKSLERLQQSLALKPEQKDVLELKKKVESNR